MHSFYCMRSESGDHKVGFTKFCPSRKCHNLQKRYEEEFSPIWIVPSEYGRKMAQEVEQWWLHVITQEHSPPSRGEEFFDLPAELLRSALDRSATLGGFQLQPLDANAAEDGGDE